MILYNDLSYLHKKIEKALIGSFKKNLNNSSFVNSGEIEDFENEFAKYLGVKFVVGCSNGSDAIAVALKALITKSIENKVILMPNISYLSTLYSALRYTCKIIFCDIDIKTGLIDIQKFKKILEKNRIDILITVNLNGSIPNQKKILSLKNQYKFNWIEDAAHSVGSKYCNYDCQTKNICKCQLNNQHADISTYSFYPGKNLGALGDAGCLTTNRSKFYERLKKLVNLGGSNNNIENYGYNHRLDAIQANFLKIKLKTLDNENLKRNKIKDIYIKYLSENKKISIIEHSNSSNIHTFPILVKNIDLNKLIKQKLKKNKIEFRSHYSYTLSEIYNKVANKKKLFSNLESSIVYSKSCISLPIHPYLKVSEVKKICKLINIICKNIK